MYVYSQIYLQTHSMYKPNQYACASLKSVSYSQTTMVRLLSLLILTLALSGSRLTTVLAHHWHNNSACAADQSPTRVAHLRRFVACASSDLALLPLSWWGCMVWLV